MSTNKEGIIFAKIALKKDFISKGDLQECIKRRDELREKGQDPNLKSILIGAGYITPEEAGEIDEILEQMHEPNKIPGYKMHEKLGAGAMGTVYKATQLNLDRSVAIKLLYPSEIEDESFVKRFQREARSAASLSHDNIIQGIDVGEQEGLYYFVMEYVDGESLDEILEEEGRITEQRALDVGLQMARALQHAEKNHLVHRDVKPANIMLDHNGTAKLCDLGLAKQVEAGDSSITQTGVTIGTPHYMSPEQARDEELDIRTDIYGLGASLYHAATGEVPFDGTAGVVISKHISDDPEPPSEKEPSLSSAFDAVIMKMMEKEPEDRYKPGELITDIEHIREGQAPEHVDVKGEVSRSRDLGRRLSDGEESSVFDEMYRWQVLVAGVLLLVGYLGYVAMSSGDAEKTLSETETLPEPTSAVDEPTAETEGRGEAEQTAGSDASARPTLEEGVDISMKDSALEQEEEGAKEEHREAYQQLKQAVDAFDGGQEEVRTLAGRMSGLIEKTNAESLKHDIRVLRKEFLEQQAKQLYNKRFSEDSSSDDGLTQLVDRYGKLNQFPSLYRNTSVGNRLRERKTSIAQLVQERLRKLKDNLRSDIQSKAFAEAEESFRKLETFYSKMEQESPGGAGWFDENWNRRVSVTVNGSKVAGDLDAFPVYVDLSEMPDAFFQNVKSKKELRVTAADGHTQLPREVVSLDRTNRTGELHFLAKHLDSGSNKTFYVYYDSTVNPSKPSPGYRRNEVWTNGFMQVQHLTKNPRDAVGADARTTVEGDAEFVKPGKLGGAFSFDGDESKPVEGISQEEVVGDARPITISTWFKQDDGTVGNEVWYANQLVGNAKNGKELNLRTRMKPGSYDWLTWGDEDGNKPTESGIRDQGNVSVGEWKSLIAIAEQDKSRTTYTLHVNGGTAAGGTTLEATASEWTPGSVPLAIGAQNREGTLARSFHGDIDEVRFSDTARSAKWVATEFRNQNRPSTFLSIGDEVSRSEVDTESNNSGSNNVAVRNLVARIGSGGDGRLNEEWKKLRTTYLRTKSRWEREKLAESENLLREFQKKYRNYLSLSDTSILDTSDGQVTDLIETYAENIPMEALQREVSAYREDVDRLSTYRDRMKMQLQRVISNGKQISLSVEEDSQQGKLTSIDGGTLKIRSDDQTSVRSLASFDIEWRISMVKREMEEVKARDQFTFGLVSYLAGRIKVARSWMEDASASGYDRANHYLEHIERRMLTSLERKARRLIQSLERAKDYEMELAKGRILADLEPYRYTNQYRKHRTLIHNELNNITYEPLTFMHGLGTSKKRKRTGRILAKMKAWYRGEVRQGSERETVELTYDCSERNQLADWKWRNSSGMKISYDEKGEAVQVAGSGLLLHDVRFAGDVQLEATVSMNEGIRNTGGVVMWKRNRGYRGMVNWRAGNRSNVIPAVLQKFQIAAQNGGLDFAKTKLKNLSWTRKNGPGKNTITIRVRYNDGHIRFALDGRKVASAYDAQFTRGRSGILLKDAQARIRKITITGTPDVRWFEQKRNRLQAIENLPDPDAHFPLDEDGSDISENKLDSQLRGDAKIISPGIVGSGALNVDGDGDFLKIKPNNVIHSLKRNYTISIWFRVDDPGLTTRKQMIYEQGDWIIGANMYVYDGELTVGGWSDTANPKRWYNPGTYLSTSNIKPDTWHHVVATLDGEETVKPGAWIAYIDGEQFAEGPGAQIVEQRYGHEGANAGAMHNQGKFPEKKIRQDKPDHELAGAVDDLRIYNGTLTAEQVHTLYKSAKWIGASRNTKASTNSTKDRSDRGQYDGPLTFQDVDVGRTAFALNLGGKAIQGNEDSFQSDPYGSDDETIKHGTASTTNESITAQNNEQIYQTQRQGNDMSFVFPLANGRYDVTLYFVEDRWQERKKRLFNVFLQENRVLHEFDIHAESGGKNNGISKTIRNVPVGNERLFLDVNGIKQKEGEGNATIAGVSIKRTRRVDSTATAHITSDAPEFQEQNKRSSPSPEQTKSSSQSVLQAPENTDSKPHWIWLSEQPERKGIEQTVYFRKEFELNRKVSKATLHATGDNHIYAYVNGKPVCKSTSWKEVEVVEVTSLLRDGTNVIAAKVTNMGKAGGLLAGMIFDPGKNQNPVRLGTDQSWRMSREVSDDGWTKPGFDDRNWRRAHTHGVIGDEPWGDIQFMSPQ